MEHPILTELLMPILDLFNDVKRKALMRLEYEGLHTTEAITLHGSRFHNDPAGYAMDRYAYYVCYKCNKVRELPFVCYCTFTEHCYLFMYLIFIRGLMVQLTTEIHQHLVTLTHNYIQVNFYIRVWTLV